MVTKSYDNGMLPASTIGIIVGCIVAGVLVVVAIRYGHYHNCILLALNLS